MWFAAPFFMGSVCCRRFEVLVLVGSWWWLQREWNSLSIVMQLRQEECLNMDKKSIQNTFHFCFSISTRCTP